MLTLSTDYANVKEVTFPEGMASGSGGVQGKGAVWESLIRPDEKRPTNARAHNLPRCGVSGVRVRVSLGAEIFP